VGESLWRQLLLALPAEFVVPLRTFDERARLRTPLLNLLKGRLFDSHAYFKVFESFNVIYFMRHGKRLHA